MRQNHKANTLITKCTTASSKLVSLYEDKDASKKTEIDAMSGSGSNLFSTFYDKLSEIRDYHRTHSALPVYRYKELEDVKSPDLTTLYSGEEQFGKTLDLHNFHEEFINLAVFKNLSVEPTDFEYMEYLSSFGNLATRLYLLILFTAKLARELSPKAQHSKLI